MEMTEGYNYRDILNEHFLIRKEFNSSYSLRSYAKDLGLPSSNLSSVLKGKQGLSKESAKKISISLKFNKDQSEQFVDLVLACDARSKREKLAAKKRLSQISNSSKTELRDDYFKLISDWYYYAILELLTTDNFYSDEAWISEKLGLSIVETQNALERLVRLKLIKKNNDEYISTNAQLETVNDVPSYFIKKHNTQILRKATESIFEQSVEERELSTLTIAVNSEDIDFVKQRIREFKKDLDKELMARNEKRRPNKVYCLAIQFFDLLKGSDK